MPIAVIRRFIKWFEEFGIPIGGVVVNMRIDPNAVHEKADAFVKNRLHMQDEYMQEIEQLFGPMVRAVIPLYETEVRGVPMLKRVAAQLFA